jgi:hypothetical protein
MTIRDKLNQAKRHELAALKWFMAPAAALILLGLFRLEVVWYYWLALAFPIVGISRFFWRMTEVPCPRCQRPLGHATGYGGEATWQYKCPHCGLGPDENPAA